MVETTNATNHEDVDNEYNRRGHGNIYQQNGLNDAKYMGEAILPDSWHAFAAVTQALYERKAAGRKRKINVKTIKKLRHLQGTIDRANTGYKLPVVKIIAMEQKILQKHGNNPLPH